MAPEISRGIRQVTFALVVLASAATEVTAVDGRALPASMGWALLWVALAAIIGWLLPAPTNSRALPPRFVLGLLIALTAAPFLAEAVRRGLTDDGYPLELQMVFALRNLGLGLAACGNWWLCLRVACVSSLFLMLFAVSLTDHPAVLTLLGLYSATGSVWLMLVHWAGLRQYFIRPETAVALEVLPGRQRLPWVPVFVVVASVGSVLGLISIGPQRAVHVLAEWLPTSGGTGGYDPFARGGVNDGDDETRGANATSTGMVETDTFLDSPLPSLYDMFNDLYGEPFKPKVQERAIALDSNTRVNESRGRPSDNLRPNREFPTTRKSPRQPRSASDRAARALFELQGATPLHIRVTAFDTFDGQAWQEASLTQRAWQLEKEPKSCWMQVRTLKQAAIFAEIETHQFKIAKPFGTFVPTPPQLSRFRVGRVNRADFFAWRQDRILQMAERKTPSGIIVETECRTVDPRRLSAVAFGTGFSRPDARLTPPSPSSSDLVALADEWAGDQPPGWPQIAAVVERLRSDYTLDDAYRAPEDCSDPLRHFLLHARRGPDYQFAGAATVMLRMLGYRSRLVSGFYASPEHYDPLSRHTPVVAEDLHFWAEVMLPCGDWLVLEPTPGYEVLAPRMAISELLWTAAGTAAAWMAEHAIVLSLSAIVVAGVRWRRRELCDALALAVWRLFPGRTWQQCLQRAVGLLEKRARSTGRGRRPDQTIPTWLRLCCAESISRPAEIDQLMCMAEWAAYANGLLPPWEPGEAQAVCRRILDAWTLQHWRRGARATTQNGASS